MFKFFQEKQITDLEDLVENNEMGQMEINHKINSMENIISEYKEREEEIKNNIVIRFNRESLNIEKKFDNLSK